MPFCPETVFFWISRWNLSCYKEIFYSCTCTGQWKGLLKVVCCCWSENDEWTKTVQIIKFCTRIPYLFYYKFQSSYLYRPFLVRVQTSCKILCREGILRHRFYRFFWTLLMNILLENTVNHEDYHLNCLELSWKFNYKKWLF